MSESILQEIQSSVPLCNYHVNVSIGDLIHSIEQFEIDLNPEYQRGHVWSAEQERKFVGAMLENHKAIPPFWFNWTNKKFNRSDSEIVDGKQRITALLHWLAGDIIAECPCGISIHYSDLSEIDNRNVENYILMDWNFVQLSRKDVMKFYLRLNSGGTIHNAEELDRVKKLIENE